MLSENGRIRCRCDAETIRLIKLVSNAGGEQLGEFVRRALRTELARLSDPGDSKRKGLGVQTPSITQQEAGWVPNPDWRVEFLELYQSCVTSTANSHGSSVHATRKKKL